MSAGTTSSIACVDANVVIRVLDAPRYPGMLAFWNRLSTETDELIAPALLGYEVANVLQQQQRAGVVDARTAVDGLRRVLSLPISLHGDAALHVRALELAAEHDLPATYDAHYLALAERYRAPLWTCDQRLAGAVAGRLPWIRLVSRTVGADE